MNNSCEKDLLGFVLGALDASEQKKIQEAMDCDPKLEEELIAIKNAIAPLDHLDSGGQPPGLARRTCELVASVGQFPHHSLTNCHSQPELLSPVAERETILPFDCGQPEQGPFLFSELESATTHSSHSAPSPAPRSGAWFSQESRLIPSYRTPFSLVDFAFAAGFMLILSGILFPAISYTRYYSRITHCQNNLREIGNALHYYSQANQGRLVEIPRSGPMSVVGSFAPILKEAGLVEDDSLFACAAVAAGQNTPPVRIPTRETIERAVGDQLLQLQKSLSGHYGYTMGFSSAVGNSPLEHLGRSFVVLVADSPSLSRFDRISLNHGGRGQNCLFEDGRVQFIVGDSFGEDALFFNDYHLVAPGCRPGDNVIAPSHLSPVYASAMH